MEKKRLKIAVVEKLVTDEEARSRLERFGDVTYYDETAKTDDEWLERCKGADIICSGIFGMRSEKAYELKDVFISLPTSGYDFVDIERLKKRNISVSVTPGCNKEAVSEWIIGMLIMSIRELDILNRIDNKERSEILKDGIGIYGKNVSILGYGNVGKEVGKLCKAFNMNVKYFKRGDDLLDSVKDADIVINCLSANDESLKILDRDFFLSLKKGAFFISVARSATYDLDSLKEALDKGILVGAADDAATALVGNVNDEEYRQFLSHPKISVTPHISWNTDYTKEKSEKMMIDNIEAWIKGEPVNLI